MASRFWKGGGSSTNWNATGPTNWSTTNGGANNASVPISTDDVFFTSLSGVGNSVISANISIQSLDCTGYTGTITHNAAITLTLAGSGGVFKLVAGMTYTLGNTTTSALSFTGTAGTMAVTTGGKTLGNVTFNGVGGTWSLQDTLNTGATATITLTNGTLNANNQNLSIGLFSSSNANTRTITMGSGTWTLKSTSGTIWDTTTTTNLTLTRGTSTVDCTATPGAGRTLSMNAVAVNNLKISAGTDTVTFTSVSCNDLDFTGFSGTWAGTTALNISGSLTISAGMTRTFTSGGLGIVFSATSGIKTITSNGKTFASAITFNGVGGTWQFQDDFTNAAASLVTFTAGTLDANNKNINIGFLVAATGTGVRTLTMGSGTWTMSGSQVSPGVGNPAWNTSQATNFTLNPGTSTILLTGVNSAITNTATKRVNHVQVGGSGGGTVTINNLTCNDLSFPYTGSKTITTGGATNLSGSLTMPTATLTAGNLGGLTFSATSGTKTITTNGKTVATSITFNGVGGTWQFQDNWTNVTANVGLTNGTLDTNGKNLSFSALNSSNVNVRSILLGASTITLAAVSPLGISTTTNLTFNAGTSNIIFTGLVQNFPNVSTGAVPNFYDLSFSNLAIVSAETSGLIMTNSFSCHNISLVRTQSNVNKVASVSLTGQSFDGSAPVTITASGLFTISGLDANNRAYISYHSPQPINGHIEGNVGTLVAASASLSYVDFSDIAASGVATWSGISVGNALGNSGVIFTVPVTRYWVADSGNWSDSKWSATSGGATGASNPIVHDTVIFDANSFTLSGQTVALDMPMMGKDINFTGVANSPNLSFNETAGHYRLIHGSLTLAGGMTISNDSGNFNFPNLSFCGRSAHFIDTNSVSMQSFTYLRSHSGSYTLSSPLVVATGDLGNEHYIYLKSGTFNTNSQPVTCAIIDLSQDDVNPRSLILGSTLWTMNGTAVSGIQAYTGSPLVNLTISALSSTFRFTGNATSNGSSVNAPQFSFNDFIFDLDVSAVGGGIDVLSCNRIIANSLGASPQLAIGSLGPVSVGLLDFNVIGGLLITGANSLTIGTLVVDVPNVSIYFTDGITNTITNLLLLGRPTSHILMLSQNPGFTFTLNVANGYTEFVDITDSIITGSVPVPDFGGVDGGNNAPGSWAFASAVQHPVMAGSD